MAVVTKKTPDALIHYSIPEAVLRKYEVTAQSTTADADSEVAASLNSQALDLYKMEYERCAQRYDDLYQAAWTNFSYIALIAGAILTFGNDSFMTELSIFVATLPLLFWWIATFEPLNRYGDQVQARAGVIEKLINELVSFPESRNLAGEVGLRHFQDYEKRHFTIKWSHLIPVTLLWIALLAIALQKLFGLSQAVFWIAIGGAIICLILWWRKKYKAACESPANSNNNEQGSRFWQHLLRVRLIVRTFAGAIIIVAICSAYGAYQRHNKALDSEPYIKSSKADSKLPERVTIKVEK